ncbi:MAG: replication initiator protein [Microviridae sp.]|nr:MAG: replication initiator protein [Microviridae sp.]
MLCRNPYMQSGLSFGCGQCMHCRINNRRHWANRLMLESTSHEFNCFVTLTYDDDHLPKTCGCKACSGYHETGTLKPKHGTDFLKRLRFDLSTKNRVCRFYWVGEYGDTTQRPHYHALLFGVSEIETSTIQAHWPYGHVMVGECNIHTASYTAQYVTKKLTKSDDPLLNGRHPEYARMSNRPGIGAYAADSIGDTLLTKAGTYVLESTQGEPPSQILVAGKRQPLHRYLKGRIRRRVGLPEYGINSPSAQAAKQRLQDLLGADALLPEMARKQALLNKTEHLARARLKRQSIWQSQQKGKTL